MPAFIVATSGKPRQLTPAPFDNEKDLQTFFEQNLDTLLGVRFVASEFSTGAKYAGRIDSLGRDEVGNPVIVEYKWDKSDSVINQGLFYLDWLMDHRGDFAVAVPKPPTGATWPGPLDS
jgi:RecB family endonuclease NucS